MRRGWNVGSTKAKNKEFLKRSDHGGKRYLGVIVSRDWYLDVEEGGGGGEWEFSITGEEKFGE